MRIGIVNDMPMAREALRRVVASVPGHEVAWLASDGEEAVEAVRRDRPDLVIMDLVMPGVDGAEATRRIMSETPCPILVVTSSVSGQLGKVYEAMGHGALDAVDAPTLGPQGDLAGASGLLQKIRTIGKLLGHFPSRLIAADLHQGEFPSRRTPPVLAIGCSTGGPNAVSEVLSRLPEDLLLSIVVVQHVDPAFAPGIARWLAEQSGWQVDLISGGETPEPGRVLFASTGDHLVLDTNRTLHYVSEPVEQCFRPSVDVFFRSLRKHWPVPGVAVVLTGMGRDGASGMLGLRDAGWHTIAQDAATSVIYGMPKAAAQLGAAVEVLPVSEIAPAVVRHLSNQSFCHR